VYRLAVFGGMMDPPHRGHRAVVDAVFEALDIDRVVVVVAGVPPHRAEPTVSARARLTMAVRAFADLEHVVVSDTEVERGEHGEPGYTIDTLTELMQMPSMLGYNELKVELSLVLGADRVVGFEAWHEWQSIVKIAELVVIDRPGLVATPAQIGAIDRLAAAGAQIRRIAMPEVDISSSQVRDAAQAMDEQRVSELVPTTIVDDVVRLYGERSGQVPARIL
jgi:nicotinate-nucleotide adenylyltransferase